MSTLATLNSAAVRCRTDGAASSKGMRAKGPQAAQLSSRRNVQCAFWGKKTKAEAKPEPVTAEAAPAAEEASIALEGASITTNGVESTGTIVIKASQIVIQGPTSGMAAPAIAAPTAADVSVNESEYLTGRAKMVQKHFETALGMDDFMQRAEMALFAYGFTGDNSIAMVNLCRDEVTVPLKHSIETVFGSAFSTNGLGGVLTCGTTGMGAGFSHSPLCGLGRERYVFFSFPHISINAKGEVGPMSRPGRPGQSCACGALIKSLAEISTQGLACNCKIPGVHEALDPEYTILKQRLARRLRYEGNDDESVKKLTLTDMTKVAERTITDDLEYLISKTVDPAKADYAVITGVQIHNWSTDFEDDSPNMEFVAPTSAYVVVNGQKTHIDLAALPPMTPRQMRLLTGESPDMICNRAGNGTLREADAPYHFDSKDSRRAQAERLSKYSQLMSYEGLDGTQSADAPSWLAKIGAGKPLREEGDNSTVIDQKFASDKELTEIWELLEDRYKMPASSSFNSPKN